MMPPIIQVRDSSLNRVAELAEYSRLEVLSRDNDCGTWQIDLPFGAAGADLLFDDGAGLYVEQDGARLIAGPVRNIDRVFDGSGDRLRVSGVSDCVWLQRRLAFPDPDGDFSLQEFDVRTGVASTVMRQYVDVNVGPSALVDRRVAVLAPDPVAGSVVTGRARFDLLNDLLRELALAGGDLTYRLVDDGAGQIVFEVGERRDLSGTAVFSPDLGNVASFQFRVASPDATRVVVGGAGEGVARDFLIADEGVSRFGLIERFVDARQASASGELAQASVEALADAVQPAQLLLEPLDTDAVKFGRDYRVGDIVTVEVDGVPVVDAIRQVRVTYDDTGVTVAPSVSAAGDAQTLRLWDELREQRKRVGLLERRR